MSFEEKRRAAEAMMAAAGFKRNAYAPWGYRLMWMLGLNVPPPHFAGYGVNAVLMSAWFVIAVAVIRIMMEAVTAWLGWTDFAWRTVAVWWLTFVPFGLLFGPLLALYFAWSARKHRLPRWSELG